MSLKDITFPSLAYDYAKNRPEKVINRISPSQIGRCHRVHYYKINHVKETTPPNPGAILNFQVGFLWEAEVANWLRSADIPFIEQHHLVDEDLNMEGTLDFAPFDPETGEWEVWDSKTEGMNAAMFRKREGNTFFEHHPEYVHQLNCYAIMLTRKGFNVSQGRFGVIIKDNGLISENITAFPDDSILATKLRIDKLNSYLRAKQVPPCSCEGWMVGYCGFGDVATQEPNSRGKVLNTKCCAPDLMNVSSEEEK